MPRKRANAAPAKPSTAQEDPWLLTLANIAAADDVASLLQHKSSLVNFMKQLVDRWQTGSRASVLRPEVYLPVFAAFARALQLLAAEQASALLQQVMQLPSM
jgi:hypothetical protein